MVCLYIALKSENFIIEIIEMRKTHFMPSHLTGFSNHEINARFYYDL